MTPGGTNSPAIPPGVTIVSPLSTIAEPPCAYGYLIVWVVSFDDADPTDPDRTLVFDGVTEYAQLPSRVVGTVRADRDLNSLALAQIDTTSRCSRSTSTPTGPTCRCS